jgi:dTDP-4-dehydrorhamnose reductase
MNLAWVTGAGGLIGSHVVRSAPPDWRVVALTREKLDVAEFDEVRARFAAEQPQLVIHCAAMAKANDCEADPHRAWRVNCDATRVLAEAAASVPLLFFSTDLVFDGSKGHYTETDAPHPLTVYAKTKIAAEQAVLANPLHSVVRTSLNGGISPSGDRSFTEQLINAWRAGRTPKLYADEFRSPMMVEVTARAIWDLVGAHARGLFHLGGSERMSRFDAGKIVASHFPQLNPTIARGSLREFSGPPRSPDTSLDSSKAQALLSLRLPSFRDAGRESFAG